MPWSEERVMSLKLKFVEQARGSGANIAALCREYGISRQTGHKWLRRYHEDGPLGLVEQTRRPRSSPLSKAEDIVAAIVELRDRRTTWGPDKIARVLAVKFGSESPSKSTVARDRQARPAAALQRARRAAGHPVRQRLALGEPTGPRWADQAVGVADLPRHPVDPLAPRVPAGQRRPRADAPRPGRAAAQAGAQPARPASRVRSVVSFPRFGGQIDYAASVIRAALSNSPGLT